MPVIGLNHINIRTPDYAETVAFLSSVLGMTVAVVPSLSATDRAAWVCDANGSPIFHIARADVPYNPEEKLPESPPRGSGAVHHLALSCSDYKGMKKQLELSDVRFRENCPAKGVKQLFVQDPSGITFELNFSTEPSADSTSRDHYVLGHPPRLSPLPSQHLSAEQQAILHDIATIVVDGVRKPRNDPQTLEILIRHAQLYNAHLEFGKKFLSDAEMPIRDRELAVLRIGWLSQAPFEWGAHVAIAKRNGISTEEVERVTAGSAAPGWSDHERALIRAMEELHFDSMITDETWTTLAVTYTDKQLIEVPLLAGQYKTVAYLQNSLRLPVPPGNAGLTAR